jgi:thiol-disulfide isomerase/thioredoxin
MPLVRAFVCSVRVRLVGAALAALTCGTTLGCSRVEPEPKPSPKAADTAASAGSGAASAGAMAGPLVLARGVRIVHAPSGSDAAKVVRDERERAKSDGRDLVVYVGARWCEPCKYFHKAAEAGELDGSFPDLTLLEFDLDDDRDRLTAAGYVSQFIPLFAMPAADGRMSDKKFEGAVKGKFAVANITPRLQSLLEK